MTECESRIAIIPMELITEEDVKGYQSERVKHMLKERAVKVYEAKEAEFPEAEQIRELRASSSSESNRCKVDGSY